MFSDVLQGLESLWNSLGSIADFFQTLLDRGIETAEAVAFAVRTALKFIVQIPEYCLWVPVEALMLVVLAFIVVLVRMFMKGG